MLTIWLLSLATGALIVLTGLAVHAALTREYVEVEFRILLIVFRIVGRR